MRRIARSFRWQLCAAMFLAGYAAAAEVVPVGDFRFLGGQYFFNNSPSSLSGNLSFTVVPAVKLSDSFSLIPTYMGAYRGTKEVNDLAGGGTLFQDSQSHLVGLKAVYSPVAPLKLKVNGSYRFELLRETKDENWGQGLFDYRKLDTGFEAEYAYLRQQSIRAGFDIYTLSFPNYESLESSVTGSGLGRELAGTKTLDCSNAMATIALNNTFGRLRTELSCSRTAKDYSDQPLVLASGNLSRDKRQDTYSFISANVVYPFKLSPGFTLAASLDYQYAANDSNQAHYDAQKYQYIADYYDYARQGYGGEIHFIMGKKPWAITIGGMLNRQNYAERPIQDASGNYTDLNEKIYIDENIYTIGIVYPLAPQFKLRISSSFIDAKSNMKYDKTFAYTYQSSSYLMGFSYEF